MVEEGTSRADRAPRTGGPQGHQHPPAPPHHGISVVGKAVWSVARAGKGWRFERAVGVDCSLPEPRCIWLTSLQNDNAEWWERRWRQAGAAMARQKCRGLPRVDRNLMVRDVQLMCLCLYARMLGSFLLRTDLREIWGNLLFLNLNSLVCKIGIKGMS